MERLAPDTTAAWTSLVHTTRVLLEAVEAALKAAGLPPLAWYDALWEIERAGDEGVRPFVLQDRLLLPQYGTSRLLDRILKAGLIEKVATPEDGRGFAVRITAAGRRMRAASWPVYRGVLADRIEARVPAADLLELRRILRAMR